MKDTRKDKNRIGFRKSGGGNETGDVLFASPVDQWFKQTFQAELLSSGLLVVPGKDSQAIRIKIRLEQFFVEEDNAGFIYAIVIAIVNVSFQNGAVYERRFVAKSREQYRFLDETNVSGVMQKTTKLWMTTAVTETVELINAKSKSSIVSDAKSILDVDLFIAGWKDLAHDQSK